MKRVLDWNRTYDIVCGPGADHLYEQDHRKFDHNGIEVGGEDVPEIEPVQKNEQKLIPGTESDEDVKLEALHNKLTALGIKYHHRAGIPTLEKLLAAAELKKAEAEAKL